MESTERVHWRRPGSDLAATTTMSKPADEEHDEDKHLHQVNLQRGHTGADVARMNLMDQVTRSEQEKHVPSTTQGFEGRDKKKKESRPKPC